MKAANSENSNKLAGHHKGKGEDDMNDYKLADVETKFADIIWEHAPIPSPELVKLCKEQLNWKKSTTYTVLKKLIDKGIFRNQNAIVTVLIPREEFYGRQSRKYVEETFGSLPCFLTAFFRGKKLSAEEAKTLREYIDHFEE